METYPSKNIAIAWVEKGSLARNLFLSLGFAIVTALIVGPPIQKLVDKITK